MEKIRRKLGKDREGLPVYIKLGPRRRQFRDVFFVVGGHRAEYESW